MIGLYLHVPFCRTSCGYCDFVREPVSGDIPERFIDALCRQIASFSGPDEAGTVYLGGGTPSLLGVEALERIFAALQARFRFIPPAGHRDCEISIEANPDDISPELAKAWQEAGINRASVGVQSFDDRVLRYLGRRHDADGARRACTIVGEAFENWSMDLIFGAHPISAWGDSLRECARLAPAHVSAYGLTYEPGTAFEQRMHEAIDDDTALQLYHETEARLDGYVHYEISNFARPGKVCVHNLVYWHNEEYAGFGPGAYSFVDGVRSRNLPGIEDYVRAPEERSEALHLTDREIRVETAIQLLRLAEGLSKRAYAERFGTEVEQDHGVALRYLVGRGLLVEDEERIRPTAVGFDLNNEIGLALVG